MVSFFYRCLLSTRPWIMKQREEEIQHFTCYNDELFTKIRNSYSLRLKVGTYSVKMGDDMARNYDRKSLLQKNGERIVWESLRKRMRFKERKAGNREEEGRWKEKAKTNKKEEKNNKIRERIKFTSRIHNIRHKAHAHTQQTNTQTILTYKQHTSPNKGQTFNPPPLNPPPPPSPTTNALHLLKKVIFLSRKYHSSYRPWNCM